MWVMGKLPQQLDSEPLGPPPQQNKNYLGQEGGGGGGLRQGMWCYMM